MSHEFVEGGAWLPIPDSGDGLAVWRKPGVSFHASSRALLLDAAEIGTARPPGGFDTFWYTWVLVNPGSEILSR